jgi:tight adherence protein B
MVRVLTAQGRLGGAVISLMPVVVVIGMALQNPGYFDPMFDSALGVLLLIGGIVMLVSGWLIIRKVVEIEP